MSLKNIFLLAFISVILYVTGCTNKSGTTPSESHKDSTTLPPVETKSPNSDYKPAFAGQTRIAGVKTTTPYKIQKIADKLGAPFAIVAMPDGRLMVTIKSGYMEIHDANG